MKRGTIPFKRKAVSGIIASIFLFAMLFSVGASYFLFVTTSNQQYIQSLVQRENNLDSQGMEGLIVTTKLLSSNNHVGFFVNNTGGINANLTTFLVYSSTSTPLACVGRGLPAGVCTTQSGTFTLCSNASCSTTLSPAPSFVVVNVGKGTSLIDTGYAYSSGTITVKIITARGESFSQTYPLTNSAPPITTSLSQTAITPGGSVQDNALLSYATGSAGGSVTYSWYSGGTCSGAATLVSTVTVTNGLVPQSSSVTFNSVGQFSWQAVYSGDANNPGGTSPCEPMTVGGLVSSISTTLQSVVITPGSSVYDTATLSQVTSTAGGTVTYYWYASGTCSGTGNLVSTATVTNGVVPQSSSQSFNSAGSFSWQAVYSGDANNVPATSTCEPLTASPAVTLLSTTLSQSLIAPGQGVYDTATVTGLSNPTGYKVSYYYFGNPNTNPANEDGTCSTTPQLVGTVTLPVSGVVPPSSTISGAPNDGNGLLDYPYVGSFSWDAVLSTPTGTTVATSPCESLSVRNTVSNLNCAFACDLTYVQNSYRFWDVTSDENPAGSGYAVNGYQPWLCSSSNCGVGLFELGSPVIYQDTAFGMTFQNILPSASVTISPYSYVEFCTIVPAYNCYNPYSVPPGSCSRLQDLWFASQVVKPSGDNPPSLAVSVGGAFTPTPIPPGGTQAITFDASYPGEGNCTGAPNALTGFVSAIFINLYGTDSNGNSFGELISLGNTYFSNAYFCPPNINTPCSTGAAQINGHAGQTLQVPYQTSTSCNTVASESGSVNVVYPMYCGLSTPVHVYWVTQSGTTTDITSSTAPGGGSCASGDVCFTVPSSAAVGPYQIDAVSEGGNSAWNVAYGTVAVGGSITDYPTQGPPTSVVGVSGQGFLASSPVTITLVNSGGTTIATASATSANSGTLQGATITVPSSAPAGSYTVKATDGTNSYTTIFTVAIPALTLVPTQGPAGAIVSVTGSGYTPSVGIGTFTFNGAPPPGSSDTCIGQYLTSSTGTFSCSFIVPSTAAGSYTVVAAGSDVGTVTADTASTTFKVTTPAITLNPTSGPSGTSVIVTGSGYSVSTTIGSITFNGAAPGTQTCTSQTMSATGAFGCTFIVPASPAGSYTVTVAGSDQGSVPGDTASAPFQVTPLLTTSPTQGPIGTSTTLSGSSYAASTVYGDCLSTSSTSVACISGSTGTFTATGAGAIPNGVTVKVPSGTAAGTDYVLACSITLCGSGSTIDASTTFAVTTPTIVLSPTTGSSGTSVTVTGSGYSVSTTIGSITFNGAAPGTQTCTSQTTSATGTFSCSFTATGSKGTYNTVVSGSNTGAVPADTATASFTTTAGLDPNANSKALASGSGALSGTQVSLTGISTTNSGDLVYACEFSKATTLTLSISDTAGHSWTVRTSGLVTVTGTGELECWYSYVSGTLSSDTINLAAIGPTGGVVGVVFAVSGVSSVQLFDPSFGHAYTNSGSGTSQVSASLPTTSNANDIIIGMAFAASSAGTNGFSSGTGFAAISTTIHGYQGSGGDEYEAVSSMGTYSATFSSQTSVSWITVADAIDPPSVGSAANPSASPSNSSPIAAQHVAGMTFQSGSAGDGISGLILTAVALLATLSTFQRDSRIIEDLLTRSTK